MADDVYLGNDLFSSEITSFNHIITLYRGLLMGFMFKPWRILARIFTLFDKLSLR